ncbi:dual specificity protein phosphatase 3-like [Ischnura elegans]|uniref:dual specificity protein phosphatase 3-like n=1 Tax=Ischnura elegans TaxID=197161 RepID=UPI001ED87323|nr:dual specificity protein phosphatase 3-like [Ischnura elegans]
MNPTRQYEMDGVRSSGSRIKARYSYSGRSKYTPEHSRKSYHSTDRRPSPEEKRGTTGSMLHKIMLHTKTDFQPLPGYDHKTADVMHRINAGVDCDEVYPNVFIGNSGAARNKAYLRRLEVSHILNCAEGRGEVDTGEEFYKDVGMSYLGLSLEDDSSADLECHLGATSDFIDHALHSGGRVMVNCVMGMSRSCAVVLGFLMMRRGLRAGEAVVAVRRRRNVRPNGGFLRQLAHLDNRLSRERGIILNYDVSESDSWRGERAAHRDNSRKCYDRPQSHRVHMASSSGHRGHQC